jgi:lysozyme family protein
MHDNFARALKFVWQPQFDGQPYHVTPHDPGRGTSWGVTEQTWKTAIHQGIVDRGLLAEATIPQLATILRVLTWNPIQGDELPDGVDLVMFDIAMMSGVGRAAMILQRCVGTKPDGHIGPITLNAAIMMEPHGLISALTTEDKSFMASLHAATYFGRGWASRANACQTEALNCIMNVPTVVDTGTANA